MWCAEPYEYDIYILLGPIYTKASIRGEKRKDATTCLWQQLVHRKPRRAWNLLPGMDESSWKKGSDWCSFRAKYIIVPLKSRRAPSVSVSCQKSVSRFCSLPGTILVVVVRASAPAPRAVLTASIGTFFQLDSYILGTRVHTLLSCFNLSQACLPFAPLVLNCLRVNRAFT